MQQQQPDIIRVLAIRAVRRYIDEAMMARPVICPSDCAAEILKVYPFCHMDEETVAHEVQRAAEAAGVQTTDHRLPLKRPPAGRVRSSRGERSKAPLKLGNV